MLLGGLLTSGFGWEWVFFVNVPIGVLAIVLVPRFVRESRAANEYGGYDVAGAIAITAGLMLLVYTLVETTRVGWGRLADDRLLACSRWSPASSRSRRRSTRQLVPLGIFRLALGQQRQRRRPAGGRLAVLDVLLHLALPPGGAALLRASGGGLLPAAGRRDHPVGRPGLRAGEPLRREARDGVRARARRRRPGPRCPRSRPSRLSWRRGRRSAALRGGGAGPRLLVRADHDPRGLGRRGTARRASRAD